MILESIESSFQEVRADFNRKDEDDTMRNIDVWCLFNIDVKFRWNNKNISIDRYSFKRIENTQDMQSMKELLQKCNPINDSLSVKRNLEIDWYVNSR